MGPITSNWMPALKDNDPKYFLLFYNVFDGMAQEQEKAAKNTINSNGREG